MKLFLVLAKEPD